jgi:hypothetical protein
MLGHSSRDMVQTSVDAPFVQPQPPALAAAPRDKHKPPVCPRCAYDLSGNISAWYAAPNADAAASPVTGTCAECGLVFDFADIFQPDRQRCVGLYEHAAGPRERIVWYWRTLGWTLTPWRFWSRVQMHHEIRPARLVLNLCTWALGMFLLERAIFGAYVYFLTKLMPLGQGPLDAISYYNASDWPVALAFPALEKDWRGIEFGPACAQIACVIVLYAAWPALFVVLPITRARARVRWLHIFRALIYAIWPGILVAMFVLSAIALDFITILISQQLFGVLSPQSIESLRSFANLLLLVGTWIALAYIPWAFCWWYMAIVRGWRIERGRLVWSLMALTTALAMILAYALLFPVVMR